MFKIIIIFLLKLNKLKNLIIFLFLILYIYDKFMKQYSYILVIHYQIER